MVKRPCMHDVVNFKTKLDVHQTDFALLVRDINSA